MSSENIQVQLSHENPQKVFEMAQEKSLLSPPQLQLIDRLKNNSHVLRQLATVFAHSPSDDEAGKNFEEVFKQLVVKGSCTELGDLTEQGINPIKLQMDMQAAMQSVMSHRLH